MCAFHLPGNLQNRALQACYFLLGMGLNAACNSIWQCMDYMAVAYKVNQSCTGICVFNPSSSRSSSSSSSSRTVSRSSTDCVLWDMKNCRKTRYQAYNTGKRFCEQISTVSSRSWRVLQKLHMRMCTAGTA